MRLYFEARIESQRVFMEIENTDIVVKSITRQLVTEQWGPLRYGNDDFRKSRQTLFKSEQKALAYLESIKAFLLKNGFNLYLGSEDPLLIQKRDQLFEQVIEQTKLLKPDEVVFKKPVDPVEWELFKKQYKITLPASYISFARSFNGLTFNLPERQECFLLNLAQIKERHELLLQLKGEAYAKTKCLPIGESNNGEVVVIKSASVAREETPVLDAFHEYKPAEWMQLFQSFAEFLICYFHRRSEYSPLSTIYADNWKPPTIEAEGVLKRY